MNIFPLKRTTGTMAEAKKPVKCYFLFLEPNFRRPTVSWHEILREGMELRQGKQFLKRSRSNIVCSDKQI